MRERMRRGAMILETLKQQKFAVRKPEAMLELAGRLSDGGQK